MAKSTASEETNKYAGLLAAVREFSQKPEKAFEQMVKAGIYTKQGKLKPPYKTAKA
jgi:hypothetical protein